MEDITRGIKGIEDILVEGWVKNVPSFLFGSGLKKLEFLKKCTELFIVILKLYLLGNIRLNWQNIWNQLNSFVINRYKLFIAKEYAFNTLNNIRPYDSRKLTNGCGTISLSVYTFFTFFFKTAVYFKTYILIQIFML